MTEQAEYHRARAAQELAQAEKATDRAAAHLHRELAKFHKQAVLRLDRSTLKIATEG
jgi:hypothetical protein